MPIQNPLTRAADKAGVIGSIVTAMGCAACFPALASLGAALGLGFLVALAFRVSAADRRAITIETGIQNSGLGLILIFAFFGGLGGMAVVAAFWGMWHAISGLALATLWSRRPA